MERLGKETAFNVQKAGNWAESRILEYAIVFHLLLGLGLNSLVDCKKNVCNSSSTLQCEFASRQEV